MDQQNPAVRNDYISLGETIQYFGLLTAIPYQEIFSRFSATKEKNEREILEKRIGPGAFFLLLFLLSLASASFLSNTWK